MHHLSSDREMVNTLHYPDRTTQKYYNNFDHSEFVLQKGLGVTSEKKTDDLKTFVKLVPTPPPPNFGHFYF